MNSYQLINGYFSWKFENEGKLMPTHDSLFLSILYIANRLGWKKEFSITGREMSTLMGCTDKTFRRVFSDLVDFGFIELVRKSQNQYHNNIICFGKNYRTNSEALTAATSRQWAKQLPGNGQSNFQATTDIINSKNNLNNETVKKVKTNKHNNPYPLNTDSKIFEEKEKVKIAVKEKEKIDLPFETPEFERAWQTWKRYKYEQHKFTYKSSVTEQTALGNLARLSGGKELTALKIIEQSISNGWQGFFELKNEQQNGTKSNEQRRQDLAEALMGEFGRTRNSNNGSTGNSKV